MLTVAATPGQATIQAIVVAPNGLITDEATQRRCSRAEAGPGGDKPAIDRQGTVDLDRPRR
jgi:hypothetical protein